MSSAVSFVSLPLWKGVQNKPGIFESFPFSLGWHQRGYICQTTSPEIREKVNRAYSDESYSFITQPPGFSEWANQLGRIYSDFILRSYGSLAGKSILEIGAASQHLAENLVSSYGVKEYWIFDPAIKESAKLPNIQIKREYYTESSFPDKLFDLVVSLNCFEHVPDPFAFLLTIRKSLLPGGRAILIFPDNEKQFKAGDLNAILHEHVSYLTRKMVFNLFQSAGFRILELDSKNDTMSVFLEVAGAPEEKCFPEDSILRLVDSQFARALNQTSNLLNSSLGRNERIAFHGATNGLNNLLALSNLAGSRGFTIFDGDQAKTGKYLPTCASSIHHSSDTLYRKIDRVFVSALTYYEEIKKYLSGYHHISPDRIHPIGFTEDMSTVISHG